MNPRLEQELNTVLGVVFRAQKVFGGDTAPEDPPQFAPSRDLENNLGKGFFGPAAARAASAGPWRWPEQEIGTGR